MKDYKWLVCSSLQKSIRRGRFDLAKPYVEFLWEHDRSYLTYRLGTIITEDVGIANIKLLEEYLETNLEKAKINERGGLDFIVSIVEKACNSVKDRSSCDLAYLSSYFNLTFKNDEELDSIFLDEKQDYVSRVNAGWIILGNAKFKNELLDFRLNYPINTKDKKIDDIDRFIELVSKMKLTTELNKVIKYAYLTQIENISLGLPIVQSLYNNESKIPSSYIKVGSVIENNYIKETSYFNSKLGMEIISAGIDGHTKEGKTAYYAYLKQNNDFIRYMRSENIDYQDYMKILTHCMFRIEGHEVNKRVFFPSAVNIMRDCEQLVLNLKSGNDNLDFQQIRKILIKDIDNINELRQIQLSLIKEDNITSKLKLK
ncbi:hypothetical protein GW796_10740 [archaeon]|nr:hypothetical protein [archaeon]NCQ52339.1 hypothetical protein [archaeon]